MLYEKRCPTFCRASSSSLRLFSSCLAAAAPPPPPICSSSSRLVDTFAFSYSSCRWACSSRAFFRALSASCCRRVHLLSSFTNTSTTHVCARIWPLCHSANHAKRLDYSGGARALLGNFKSLFGANSHVCVTALASACTCVWPSAKCNLYVNQLTIFFCSRCHCSLTSFLSLSSSFFLVRRGYEKKNNK